ncbi:MAG: O-acetyl-ADP-ribose deacetylase [Propionibacteriaceae bacterium]|jgi:O-acetyl-ADP-ribose deacetylase (regulator of RNase III)|nr:O-acetyl-ADP-ribose deacetylase [Propionibacteriaceae bacterium]
MQIKIELGDITRSRTDAIVNAANSTLLGGGGVDGAIHRAAGPELLAECLHLRQTSLPDGLPPGQAVATGAGNLPCRWVIHTVGPNRYAGQRDPAVLESCFAESLRVAKELDAKSVAFPAIGGGVYGWSADAVAKAAASAVAAFTDPGSVAEIDFVLFNERMLEAFQRAFG